jgi:HlyD family secretion protein
MSRFRILALVVPVVLSTASCRGKGDPSTIVASGHVEATEVRISTKVGGRLLTFPVEEGDRVAEVQELARVDTVDIELALAQARAERDQADAELRLRLSGSRKEDIAAAEAQVAQAEADLDGAERDLSRFQGLLDAGSGTTKSRDDAATRRDVAKARLDAARETLRKLEAGSRAEEIDAARARLASADARIAQLEQRLGDAATASPLAGIVTEKIAEQGELLPAGAPLCVITDLSDAWLTAYVAETDLGRIRIGQDADVVTDDGQSRKGKVTFVASQAEFTPKNVQTRDERVKLVYKVKVGLENSDGLFKPGMPAEARLRAAEAVGR